jgi:hypothetical protein
MIDFLEALDASTTTGWSGFPPEALKDRAKAFMHLVPPDSDMHRLLSHSILAELHDADQPWVASGTGRG